MPVYELHLSDQQETRLSHFLRIRFVWVTPFCQKRAALYCSSPPPCPLANSLEIFSYNLVPARDTRAPNV